MDYIEQKEQVAAFMRRLYGQRLTTASGGNVSMLVNEHILITPSQTDKASLEGKDIITMTREGESLAKGIIPSMESRMHRAVYKHCEEVRAIVHAHPPFATAFIISGSTIKTNLSGEFYAILGQPAIVPYALMGTQTLADLVAEGAMLSNVLLLQNHGVLTTGKTLFEAYDRMEVLEACAKLNLMTTILGTQKELSPDELSAIDKLLSTGI